MNEEIEFILRFSAKEAMGSALAHLVKELRTIRAGKATPAMLANVMVDYYGCFDTIKPNCEREHARSTNHFSVQPWEKNMLQAHRKSNSCSPILGFNPMNNGDVILINVPPLTEERRLAI